MARIDITTHSRDFILRRLVAIATSCEVASISFTLLDDTEVIVKGELYRVDVEHFEVRREDCYLFFDAERVASINSTKDGQHFIHLIGDEDHHGEI